MDKLRPVEPLSKLRKENIEAYEVFQIILKGLIELHWDSLKTLNLGYEATLEGFEELIEKGFLKIVKSEEGFFLEYYNINIGEYMRVGQTP